MPEPDPFVPRPDISVEPPVGPADAAGAVKIKMDRKPKSPKTKGAPKQKAQKGKDESKSKLPVLLGALAVVVLGAGAFVLLSGGDDEVDTGADVAGTTVEKASTTVVAPTTTAAVVATTAAASETTAPLRSPLFNRRSTPRRPAPAMSSKPIPGCSPRTSSSTRTRGPRFRRPTRICRRA